jgi:hypothetical protein
MPDLDTEGNLKSLIRARPGKPELAAQCIAAFWHCKCLLWVKTGPPLRRSYVSFHRERTWSVRKHRCSEEPAGWTPAPWSPAQASPWPSYERPARGPQGRLTTALPTRSPVERTPGGSASGHPATASFGA